MIETNHSTKLLPNVIGRKLQNFKSFLRHSVSMVLKSDDDDDNKVNQRKTKKMPWHIGRKIMANKNKNSLVNLSIQNSDTILIPDSNALDIENQQQPFVVGNMKSYSSSSIKINDDILQQVTTSVDDDNLSLINHNKYSTIIDNDNNNNSCQQLNVNNNNNNDVVDEQLLSITTTKQSTITETIKQQQQANPTILAKTLDNDNSIQTSDINNNSNDLTKTIEKNQKMDDDYNEINDYNDNYLVIKYENDDGDDDDNPLGNNDNTNLNDQYEIKVAEQQQKINLITKKLLYMDEHIIDLNNENLSLQKQLKQNDELFRKKIQLREDEIETLQENIIDMEKIINDLRLKEYELQIEKRLHQEDINLLKQQLIERETKLNDLNTTCRYLTEIEQCYNNVQKELTELKQNNYKIFNELEDNYRLICSRKDFEIDLLKIKINELNNNLDSLSYGQTSYHNNHQQQQQQQFFSLKSTNCSTSEESNVVDENNQNFKTNNEIIITEKLESSTESTTPSTSSLSSSLEIPIAKNKSTLDESLLNQNSIDSFNYHTDYDKLSSTTTTTTTINELKMRRKHSLKRISSCDIVDDVQSFGMPLPTINYMMNGNNNNNSNNFEDTKTTGVDCNNNNNSQTTTTNVLIQTEIFPSLPDVMLRKLCLLRENTCNIESLSEQEIDTKFHTLSLAFKTDKFTLEQRVQLYRHQRDIAENDAKNELNHLNEYVQELYRLLLGSESKYFYNTSLIQLKELKDMLDKIDMQVQVIKASMMKISSRSELFGSVKQEEKLSTAFDVILLHTENLKRSKERDAKELDDMKRLLANTGHSKYDHQDYNDFDNGGKRSKNRDSRRISSLLMTNQLQNIQVSYQQISRSGSGPSNQNYLRTRRLSVPAAEIRNRPRLLELFNEATARQLKEKDNHSDSASDHNDDNHNHNDEDDDDDEDEQMAAMARRRQISLRQRNRTLTSIDDRKEYASDNDDDNERKQSSVKQETKSLDKNECKTERRNESTTPTNSCDDSDHADDNEGNNNHCFDHDSHSSSNNEEKLSCNNSINKCNKLKIQSFYQKLVKKLIPFEDRTWRRKMIEKIQEFYCLLCMLVFTIRSIASSITESSKLKFRKLRRQTNSYDNLRFTISAIFIFVAAMILTFSVIVPMIS